MNLIDKRENGKLTTWVYTDETLRDAASAAARIARIAAGEGFTAGYIALRDLSHGVDEDNDSRRLPPDAGAEAILEALASAACDRLYLSGRYRRVRVGVGIDLHTYELSITLPEDRLALMEGLAGLSAGDE